ncbi:hypothetical protein FRB97_004383 [Tulasnella sp. 331]|nr:hypothetical protein FRB97_004383 [Tulasnella sp. 331]
MRFFLIPILLITGGVLLIPAIVVGVVGAVGFGAAGVAAGSIAAGMQGPAVAAGSLFAVLQAFGATATVSVPAVVAGIASVAGAVAAAVF